jgi:hypothetical protein
MAGLLERRLRSGSGCETGDRAAAGFGPTKELALALRWQDSRSAAAGGRWLALDHVDELRMEGAPDHDGLRDTAESTS